MTKPWAWKERAALTNRKGEEHGSVTPYQLTAILVGAVVGVGVLAFPRIIIARADTGGPLATVLGAVLASLAWLAALKLARWFPGRTPVEYALKLLTWPIGWLYGVILILFLLVITAMTVREFGAVVRTTVLPNTPIEVTILSLLLVAAYFVRFDVQVFARVYEIFFPLMLAPLTLIGLSTLKNARGYFLLPVTGADWQGLLAGALLASVGYVGYIIGPFLLPSLNRPKEGLKAGFWGIGLSLFVYLLVVSATLAVFGPEEIKREVWPTFELVKQTTVPGFILERLESAFLGVWVAAVFTTVTATYYTMLLAITQLFRLGDHKVMAFPLVPILYMVALGPSDIHALYRFVTAVGLFGVALTQGLPIVWVLIGWLLGKGAPRRARRAV